MDSNGITFDQILADIGSVAKVGADVYTKLKGASGGAGTVHGGSAPSPSAGSQSDGGSSDGTLLLIIAAVAILALA